MTSPIVILGCGAAKRDLGPDERCPAIDLYVGPLYRSRLAYARARGGPHWIASAAHALVHPQAPTAVYESDLRRKSPAERRAWVDAVVRRDSFESAKLTTGEFNEP